ncbi:hypothetical protein NHJ13051_001347 [Beauveria bassiana]
MSISEYPNRDLSGGTFHSGFDFRGDYALQVLRHLPYLGGGPPQHLHYQCEVVDYTAVYRAWFVEQHMDGDTDEWWSTLSQVPAAWMLPLALGVGREASSFYLNVVDAEVCEVVSGLGYDGPKPLDAWVDEMKQLFACLRLIPCDGKLMLVCGEVEDTEERIGEDEFRAEEGYFPTDLDVRFIRQVYREYGWPERFRYKEAMAYLLPVVEDIAKDNDDWWWMDWMTTNDHTSAEITTSSPTSVSDCAPDASCKSLENSGSGTASACAG